MEGRVVGFAMSVDKPYEDWDRGDSCRVGTNGSQMVLMGVFFAAYAADRRPEANRVCAWVNSFDEATLTPKFHPNAPMTERGRPATAAALLVFSWDDVGSTACWPQDRVIRFGSRIKPPADPDLADLLAVYLATCDRSDYSGVLAPDLVTRLAELLPALATVAVDSGWFDVLVDVAEVFRRAAAVGVGVRYG